MEQASSQADSQLKEPWNPRFSMASMLLVMLVCCTMAAEFYYLARFIASGDRADQLTFILFTLAGPGVLFTVANLLWRLSDYLERRQAP